MLVRMRTRAGEGPQSEVGTVGTDPKCGPQTRLSDSSSRGMFWSQGEGPQSVVGTVGTDPRPEVHISHVPQV